MHMLFPVSVLVSIVVEWLYLHEQMYRYMYTTWANKAAFLACNIPRGSVILYQLDDLLHYRVIFVIDNTRYTNVTYHVVTLYVMLSYCPASTISEGRGGGHWGPQTAL